MRYCSRRRRPATCRRCSGCHRGRTLVRLQAVHSNCLAAVPHLHDEKLLLFPQYLEGPCVEGRQRRSTSASAYIYKGCRQKAGGRFCRHLCIGQRSCRGGGSIVVLSASRKLAAGGSSVHKNSPGSASWLPYTSSAEDTPLASLGAALRPSSTQGRWSTQSLRAQPTPHEKINKQCNS